MRTPKQGGTTCVGVRGITGEDLSSKVIIKTPIYDGFRLPIEYLDPTEVYTVPNVVTNDLELSSTDSSFCLFSGVLSSNIYSGGCSTLHSGCVRTPELRSSVGVRGITEEDLSSKVILHQIYKILDNFVLFRKIDCNSPIK